MPRVSPRGGSSSRSATESARHATTCRWPGSASSAPPRARSPLRGLDVGGELDRRTLAHTGTANDTERDVEARLERLEDHRTGGKRSHALEVDVVELRDLLRRGACEDAGHLVELVGAEGGTNDRA